MSTGSETPPREPGHTGWEEEARRMESGRWLIAEPHPRASDRQVDSSGVVGSSGERGAPASVSRVVATPALAVWAAWTVFRPVLSSAALYWARLVISGPS